MEAASLILPNPLNHLAVILENLELTHFRKLLVKRDFFIFLTELWSNITKHYEFPGKFLLDIFSENLIILLLHKTIKH